MAALECPQSNDRPNFCPTIVQKERALLDQKALLQDEIKLLAQTFSILSINTANPSSDPALLAVAKVLDVKKKKRK